MRFKDYLNNSLFESTHSMSFSDIGKKEATRLQLSKLHRINYDTVKSDFIKASHSLSSVASKIRSFIKKHPETSKKLFNIKSEHLGRGEVLCYFIFDNITLGGGKMDIDLLLNGEGIAEVKEVSPKGDGYGDIRIETASRLADVELIKDIDYFSKKYEEITGKKLEAISQPSGWKVTDIGGQTLKLWKKIDLIKLSKDGVSEFPKKGVILDLDKRGNIRQHKDNEIISNVNSAAGVQPLKDIIDGKKEIKIIVDKKRSTIEKILDKWVESVIDSLGDKHFLLFLNGSEPKLVGSLKLSKDNLTVERITKGNAKPIFLV